MLYEKNFEKGRAALRRPAGTQLHVKQLRLQENLPT